MSPSDDDATTPAPTAHEDANLGQRVGALLLDTLIVMLPLYVVAALLFGESRAEAGQVSFSLTGWPFVLTTLVALGYFFALELVAGQTLGKKIVGIRVVSDKHRELTAGQVLVRTLLRIVDGFAFYAVGFVAALISDKNQRLGDMAGSTRVAKAR